MPKAWAHLLDDPDVARWHHNHCQGSPKTAREYLRVLGCVTTSMGLTPAAFAALGQRGCENALHDYVRKLITAPNPVGGSTMEYRCDVMVSWMKWNGIPMMRPVKIPLRNRHPRLEHSYIPPTDELRRLLNVCNARQSMVVAMMAYAGLRFCSLGNDDGSDGLRFSDLPDARLVGGELVFDEVPTRILVRAELNKSKHAYFTLLGPEGCGYLAATVRARTHRGEVLTPNSPVLHPQRGGNPFMMSESIGDLLRRPMRKVGIDVLPPYIWRSYFNNRCLLAEQEQRFPVSYKAFFMGHKGDIEAVYGLHKKVPPDMLAAMRKAYTPLTQLMEAHPAVPDALNPIRILAENLLQAGGASPAELAKADLAGMDQDALMRLLTEAMDKRWAKMPEPPPMVRVPDPPAQVRMPEPPPQVPPAPSAPVRNRIVDLDALDGLFQQGWVFKAQLGSSKAIVEAP